MQLPLKLSWEMAQTQWASILQPVLDYVNKNSDTAIPAATPSGSVIMYAGSKAPTGYLACDGSAVSRSTYQALFQAIGTTYGSGDGSTTFNLPDCRGVFVRGAGTSGKLSNAQGTAFSGTLGSYNNDQLQDHAHNLRINGALVYQGSNAGSGANNINNTSGQNNGQLFTIREMVADSSGDNVAPRQGHETAPANVVLTYCIKT